MNRRIIIDGYLLQDQLDIAEYWKENFITDLSDKTMKGYIQEIFDLCG